MINEISKIKDRDKGQSAKLPVWAAPLSETILAGLAPCYPSKPIKVC